MAKKQKITDPKDIEKKVTELKIELLKQPTKKKSIKKEIARLLTEKNRQAREAKNKEEKTSKTKKTTTKDTMKPTTKNTMKTKQGDKK